MIYITCALMFLVIGALYACKVFYDRYVDIASKMDSAVTRFSDMLKEKLDVSKKLNATTASLDAEKRVHADTQAALLETQDALELANDASDTWRTKATESSEYLEIVKDQLAKKELSYDELYDQFLFVRDRAVPTTDWIVGTSNLSKELGVTMKRTRQLMKSAGFPAPFHNVGANKLWDRTQINAWKEWQAEE